MEPEDVSTLLRVDCTGNVVAGVARARVDGSTLVLELRPGEEEARALLDAWPPRDAPPWLGHGPVRIAESGPRALRLDFPPGSEPPLLLLADRRLAPPWVPAAELVRGDGRDRIDRGGGAFHTYDERTVAYARSVGQPVTLRQFDRRYYLVLAESVDEEEGGALARRIGLEWTQGGSVDGRREAGPEHGGEAEDCRPVVVNRRPSASGGSFPTVGYAADDPAARELAERLVSASLSGGGPDLGLSGLRVRPDGGSPDPAASDVALILAVTVGAVHPCSIQGELHAAASRLGSVGAIGPGQVFPLGESARFHIESGGAQ